MSTDTADFDDDMAMDEPATPDPKTLAANTLLLLQADPSKYRTFGPYWPLMKSLLLRYYTRDNLFLLGPHVDREAADSLVTWRWFW